MQYTASLWSLSLFAKMNSARSSLNSSIHLNISVYMQHIHIISREMDAFIKRMGCRLTRQHIYSHGQKSEPGMKIVLVYFLILRLNLVMLSLISLKVWVRSTVPLLCSLTWIGTPQSKSSQDSAPRSQVHFGSVFKFAITRLFRIQKRSAEKGAEALTSIS